MAVGVSKTRSHTWFQFLFSMFQENEWNRRSDDDLLRFILSEWENPDRLNAACLLKSNGRPVLFIKRTIERRKGNFTRWFPDPTDANLIQYRKARTKLAQFRSYYNQGKLGYEPTFFSFRWEPDAGKDETYAVWGNRICKPTPQALFDYVLTKKEDDPRVRTDRWVDITDLPNKGVVDKVAV